jgi:hypothetical protein
MIPSESQLAAAIDALKGRWGSFERVGTTFVRVAPEFGDRFAGLEIRGRQGEMPVARWPDGVVERADGSWDCVEVTHSPRWRRHLDRDLPKIRELSVSGFVFVAWCPQPDQAELTAARDELVAAGVPREAIEFVFRGRLLEGLRQPCFAQLWRELGIACVPHPFRLVDANRGLVGVDAGSEEMHPTADEFRDGRVHAPRVLSIVLERLRRDRFAEVRGRGAAGKTVLAEHVVQRHRRSESPAYYLKLGSFEQAIGAEGAVEVFGRLAAPNSLFVVDDIHLNPQAAHDLQRAWAGHGNGSSMLQLGRERHIYGCRDRAAHEYPDHPPLRLTVEAEDLVGVLRRIVGKDAMGADPPVPPPVEAQRWLDLFRGDLIAFSAAVAARRAGLLRGKWRLTEGDAAWLARERYLPAALDEAERDDLLLLAVLADKELGVPTGAVRSGLPRSLEVGAVLRACRISGRPAEFRLAHPGLGRLLLAAHGEPPALDRLVDWAGADIAFALRLGLFLRVRGDDELAARVWGSAVASRRGFGPALFALPAAAIDDVLEGLDALRLLPAERLDERLSGEVKAIADGLLDDMHRFAGALWQLREASATRSLLLDELPRIVRDGGVDLSQLFGSRATSRMFERIPEARAALQAMLAAEPDLCGKISDRVLAGEVDHLPRAMRVLSRIAKPVERDLRRRIADPRIQERLAAQVATLDADGLSGLLSSAHGIEPALRERLEEAIPRSARERLIEVLRATPTTLRGFERNGHVAPLLADLARVARERGVDDRPQVAARQSRRFGSEVAVRLAGDPAQALRMDLAAVLRFVEARHRGLERSATASAVRDCLSGEENREHVVHAALDLGLDDLNRFLAWSEASAPELHDGLKEHLGGDRTLEACIDSYLEVGVLGDLGGLLVLLEKVEPRLKARAVELLIDRGRLDRLAETGFRTAPCGWIGLLRHGGIAGPLFSRLDRRRWQEFWRAWPPQQPYWARSLLQVLRGSGSVDLQRAPAEYIFGTTGRSEWCGAEVNLRNLSNALSWADGLGDEKVLGFLERIGHRSFLEARYATASVLTLARFVDVSRAEQPVAVQRALLTDGLWQRLEVETAIPWWSRPTADAAGFLALIGALCLAGARPRAAPPPSAQVDDVLAYVDAPEEEPDRDQALVRAGLRHLAAA